jgi:hypothetical protein
VERGKWAQRAKTSGDEEWSFIRPVKEPSTSNPALL